MYSYGRTGSNSTGNGSVGTGTFPVPGPEVPSWEDKTRTLREVITRGKYPCLVKVKGSVVRKYLRQTSSPPTSPADGPTGGVDGIGGTGSGTPEEEILHVIELRRHKMVVATRLQWERRTNEYTSTDKHVDINVAQKGIHTCSDLNVHYILDIKYKTTSIF